VALTVFLAGLAVRQDGARRRAGLDIEALQVLAGVMDVWNETGSFDPGLWPGVSGFGVYGPGGDPVFSWGSAPTVLSPTRMATPGGETVLVGDTLRMVRRAGTAPGFRGTEGRRGMMGLGGMMGSASRLVYLDLDVAARLSEGNPLLWVVGSLLLVFIALVALVVLFSRRLTAYRERERETSHLVQLGEAARTLAHEIKNPLGVIRVQCATLRRTVGEERLGNVAVIEEETARLSLLTDRVREFLHPSAEAPETRAARDYLERCRARWGERITVNEPEGGGNAEVTMDPSRLLQILDNLISNALEATEEGASRPELGLRLRRGRAMFTVADRGPGVGEENRAQLFRPFFTTKAKGSGIGLALSRRFAERAGGEVSWAERPGGGSVFTLGLPAKNTGTGGTT